VRKGVVIFLVFIIFGLFFFWYDNYQGGTVPEEDETGLENNEEDQIDIDPMNVLILGLDVEKGARGRTDTMMILSFRPDREEVYLMSIPRDTRVLIKGGYDKINAAYVYGGAELVRQTVEDFLDIEIDHHVVVNFEAFIKLIDLVDGIEVDVPEDFIYRPENINLKAGVQTLYGEDALAYARFRGTIEGDIGRAKRQQEVIKLLAEKLFTPKMVIKIPQIIQTMSEYTEHDFSVTEMMSFAATAGKAKSKPIESLILPGTNKKIDGLWYYLPDNEKISEIIEPFKSK
jgi:LCP family protein required for cell wall assembly